MLGPHVVGLRIVVRRVVPGETGPTGGLAMTDVLGVCESWERGTAVVRRADGSRVSIPTADIVSGKPVPPKPNVRLRVSARDAEQHALALWPAVERHPLGEWVLRSDPAPVGRLLKRANSCLAFGAVPLDAVAAVTAFYAARDRTPLAQVERSSSADDLFADAGWTVVDGGDSAFQVASTAQVLRRLPSATGVAIEQDGDVLRAVVVDDRKEVAVGRAGISPSPTGGWIGVHGLLVAPSHRRQGLATRIMAALLERGAEQGATTSWLHVETDNSPALALYDRLGFVTHHENRYRQGPTAG